MLFWFWSKVTGEFADYCSDPKQLLKTEREEGKVLSVSVPRFLFFLSTIGRDGAWGE
jgi:hypothetical protein